MVYKSTNTDADHIIGYNHVSSLALLKERNRSRHYSRQYQSTAFESAVSRFLQSGLLRQEGLHDG
jgi:hypothetical protein